MHSATLFFMFFLLDFAYFKLYNLEYVYFKGGCVHGTDRKRADE